MGYRGSKLCSIIRTSWNVWCEVLSFAWLDRWSMQHPRSARALGGFCTSAVLALYALYFLNPRVMINEKGGSIPEPWASRIRPDEVPSPHPDVRRFARQVCADFWCLHISCATVLGMGSVWVAAFTFCSHRQGTSGLAKWHSSPPPRIPHWRRRRSKKSRKRI
jgi:hypothetical protein